MISMRSRAHVFLLATVLALAGAVAPSGAARQDNAWLVAGKAIDPSARYTIGIPEFLLTGGESRLDFLNRTNPQIKDVQEFRDIRTVVMDELRTRVGRSGLLGDSLQRIPVFARR